MEDKGENNRDITTSGSLIGLRPKEEFKILYHKSTKIGIKELLKKLFLSVLKIIFPNKFLYYKENIRNIIRKFRVKLLGSDIGFDRYLYLCIKYVFIRLRYLNHFRLPYNHLIALYILNKFMKILKHKKIDFFMVAGVLLGAVRQGGFSGTASDIDLGIKEEQLPKLLDSIPLMKKNGVDWIRQWSENGNCERLQFFFPGKHVDVGVYRKKKINNKYVWIGETEKPYDQKFCGITLSVSDLEFLKPLSLCGQLFLAPGNPETYLEKKYGKNWKIPEKRQYFFNEKKFK